jgi:hypothetical protein
VRAQTNLEVVSEQLMSEDLERSLQVRHRDPLVHGESFDLRELVEVRGIQLVPAVATTGGEHVDRRILRLHRPDLNRRRVGAQNDIVPSRDEVSVSRRARRMLDGLVEGVEIEARKLDLRAFRESIAESDEDIHDLVDRRGQWMVRCKGRRVGGKGHIQALALPALLALGSSEHVGFLGERLLDLGLHRVREHAQFLHLISGHRPEARPRLGERGFPPQNLHASGIERGPVGGLLDGGETLDPRLL